MTPDPLALLHAAIRCDMAYMEPTWADRAAQYRVTIIDGVQHYTIAGTNDRTDVFNDATLFWVHRERLGVVRKGFADAWDPIRDAGFALLDKNMPIVFEAHSLGVVKSQYQACELLHHGFKILGGVGFGSPTGFDRDGGCLPACPWTHIKNGYDPVADRPYWLWRGTAGGKWWQIENGKIRDGRRHPAKKPLLFWRAAADHRLRGKPGYIYQLGAICDAAGLTKDWRRLPEALDWARAVIDFEDRGESARLVTP